MLRFGPLRWLSGLLLDHWGTKATAAVLALLFFVVTRDDVSREFTIPLRVIDDPDRLLLSDLPETVTVELHGSWARINRLSSSDLGVATLDLEEAEPGPLEIDPATIVMPQGVLFRNIVYDRVDLRFDDIDERNFPIKPEVEVDVHADYEHVSTLVDPRMIALRGGKRVLQEISSVHTEPIERTGLTDTIEVKKRLLLPRAGVEFAETNGDERPEVTVRVVVRPKLGERRIETALPVDAERLTGIPASYSVSVRGPLPDLRQLDELPPRDVIVAEARMGDGADEGLRSPASVIYVDFSLTAALPAEVRGRLSLDPVSKRFVVRPIPQ
ncbi:MAG: hypothetical protein KC486_21380 [Myxococcales bacterium]|nr:hypothetical protein [Myxococcales bacterium]